MARTSCPSNSRARSRRPSRRSPNWSSKAGAGPGAGRKRMRETLLCFGLATFLAVIAAANGRGEFGKTLLYALCTIAVVIAATGVTVAGAARLGKGRPGWGDRPGYVEAGVLIGVFLIAPAALSGAFVILNAMVGPP